MINVLKRLAELDAKNPTIVKESQGGIEECSGMEMETSGIGIPSAPGTPASINITAGTGQELSNMLKDIMTLAGVHQVGAQDIGAEPEPATMIAEPVTAVGPSSTDSEIMRTAMDKLNTMDGDDEQSDDQEETDESEYDNSPTNNSDIPTSDHDAMLDKGRQNQDQAGHPGVGDRNDGKQPKAFATMEEALMSEYKSFVNEAKEKCCCAEKGKVKCPVHGRKKVKENVDPEDLKQLVDRYESGKITYDELRDTLDSLEHTDNSMSQGEMGMYGGDTAAGHRSWDQERDDWGYDPEAPEPFDDEDDLEDVAEGAGGPSWPEVISALTQGYPDIDTTDALKPLMQKYRVSYDYFDKLAQQQGYKDVFDAYAEFEELPTTGPTMSKGVAEAAQGIPHKVRYSYDDPSGKGIASGHITLHAPDKTAAARYAVSDLTKRGKKNAKVLAVTPQKQGVAEGASSKCCCAEKGKVKCPVHSKKKVKESLLGESERINGEQAQEILDIINNWSWASDDPNLVDHILNQYPDIHEGLEDLFNKANQYYAKTGEFWTYITHVLKVMAKKQNRTDLEVE